MTTTHAGTHLIGEDSVLRLTWLALPNAGNGVYADSGRYSDKTVQVTGTFGSAGSVTIKGSNDATNWVTMNDTDNNALTFTSAGGKLCRENYRYIRPEVTAGDGTTSLNVYISAPAK